MEKKTYHDMSFEQRQFFYEELKKESSLLSSLSHQGVLSKVAKSVDFQTFDECLKNNRIPTVKLTKQEMENTKGGFRIHGAICGTPWGDWTFDITIDF